MKKGEMGIGTLIIFISLLLVAAIAAGVLIQTSGSLQEKALTTGDQAKGQIATNVRVVEVSASDGSNGSLRNFTQIIKLAPGSDPIKLEQTLFTINTFDKTATLNYAGITGTVLNEPTGYYTLTTFNFTGGPNNWQTIQFDYNEDGQTELIQGGNDSSNVYLNFTNASGQVLLNLGTCVAGVGDNLVWTNQTITRSTLSCVGNNATGVYIVPTNEGTGKFSVEYIQEGSNFVEGNLQRGDVIKLFYEAPKFIKEDEEVRLNFIPKIGTPTLTQFVTPEVISEERVYLYP